MPRCSKEGIESLLESESFARKNLFSGFQHLFHIPMVTTQVPRKTLAALLAPLPCGPRLSDFGCGRSSWRVDGRSGNACFSDDRECWSLARWSQCTAAVHLLRGRCTRAS